MIKRRVEFIAKPQRLTPGRRAAIWAAAGIAASAVVAVITGILVEPNTWSGIGQWIGGIGSLAAAGAALYISRDETRREQARGEERARVHAFYVEAEWMPQTMGGPQPIAITNKGTEPVTSLAVMAVHVDEPSRQPLEVTADSRAVLLPGDTWSLRWEPRTQLSTEALAPFISIRAQIEIVYSDLRETRWHRIGNQPPMPYAI